VLHIKALFYAYRIAQRRGRGMLAGATFEGAFSSSTKSLAMLARFGDALHVSVCARAYSLTP